MNHSLVILNSRNLSFALLFDAIAVSLELVPKIERVYRSLGNSDGEVVGVLLYIVDVAS